jgi:DNA polymerase-3 subunit gamma/tau
MSYRALYRQWRPADFDEVIGQHHITASLKNQISARTFGHAYIFSGTRGTGKTSTAKIFAKAVNCLNPKDGNPCNVCENCKSIIEEQFIDVVEMDAASNNSVDDIRELREHVKFSPSKGSYKVYIIDEVHMLSQGAFNALLKTLEEPPEYVVFILATTEIQKIPATILSRCQRYDFKRVSYEELLERLESICKNMGIVYEEEALKLIIQKSDGAVRDSLSSLDQCLSARENRLMLEDVVDILGVVERTQVLSLIQMIAQGEGEAVLRIVDDLMKQGKDLQPFIQTMLEVYRDLIIVKMVKSDPGALINGSDESVEALKEASFDISQTHISRAMETLIELSKSLKFSQNKRIVFESALLRMMHPEVEERYEALLERIEHLEKRIASEGIRPTKPKPAPSQDHKVTQETSDNVVKASEIEKASSDEEVSNDKENPLYSKGQTQEVETVEKESAPAEKPEIEHLIEFSDREVDLKAVRAIWPEFLEKLKHERKGLYPILQNAQPTEVDGGKCVISLPPDNGLFLAMLSTGSNAEYLEEAFSNGIQKRMHLEFNLKEPEAVSKSVDADASDSPVDSEEAVRSYFKEFEDVLVIKK